MRKIDNSPERFLFDRLQRKLEHFSSSIRNDFRVDQLEETFLAPDSARNFLIHLDEFRLVSQAGLEIHRGAKEFPVLSLGSSWRR